MISLDICIVTDKGNTLDISIPYWIPTFFITKANEQKYFDINVPKANIIDNCVPLSIVIAKMDEISNRNPYRNLRAKNPHIVDYRRLNIGKFAPKKRTVKMPVAEYDTLRAGLLQINKFVVPEHEIYYVPVK